MARPMNTPALHSYRFGQSRVDSAIPLPVLPPARTNEVEADIILDAGPAQPALDPVTDWLHHWLQPNGTATLSLAAQDHGYRLRFPGLCDFLVDADARRIRAEPVEGLDPGTLEHLVVDQLLPRVLAHQGALVAHASVVLVEGRAILFLGHSGWGKSTLAGLLHGTGRRLLSDDCALLVAAASATHVIPTYPSLRLFGDSIGQTLGAEATTSPVSAYSPKQRLTVTLGTAHRDGQAWPLQAIYLLNDPARPARGISITPLPPALACMALVEHSFRLDLASTAHTAALLAQAAAVLRHVPAFTLRYPRDYTASPVLLDTLVSHAASLAPPVREPA